MFQVAGMMTTSKRVHSKNWYMWNPITETYTIVGRNLRHAHFFGDFTRIPEDALILRACTLDGSYYEKNSPWLHGN